MSVDWDSILLAPVMGVFGEGDASQSATWPIYYPTDLQPFPLEGAVFDRAYADVTLDSEGSENTSRKPCLGVRLSLFAREPAQSEKVYIPSVPGLFIVKDYRPDGHGHAKLILMGPV